MKSTGQVTIQGKQFSCLLDTGSQVTTVTKSFHDEYLHEQQIKPLYNLLEVEGANGQSVPYLGYVEVTITFPKQFLGAEYEVPTLALVVPDSGTSGYQILVGTNTLDVAYGVCREKSQATYHPVPNGYRTVLKVLQLRQEQSHDSDIGLVRMQGRDRKLIPAGGTVVLEGVASVKGFHTERSALIGYPSSSSLPGGLLVKPCLIDLLGRLPVVVLNESEHDIIIPAKSVIAELSAIQTILSHKQNVTNPSESELSKAADLAFDFGESPVPPEWKDRITRKLNCMPEVFAQNDTDFGRTDKVKHHVKLSDETPFKLRARPIHPHDVEAVRQHLQELLDAGVIRESESPFSSPIVVVRKKNGQVRLCIDYRKLNLQTVKDAYALPRMDDTFTALSGSKWFSVLDLKSGYYQIEVDEADKPKTAFVCPLGFWEFNRMPQGVTNAPSTFQRLMEKCMGDMNLKEVVVFLDDLIVFSKTLEDHEARLTKVLNRLKEYGLKLSPENAFEMIIGKLTTSPVLAFANPALPYILHTDASSTGLGAALYQEQEGQLRVIAYASRGLSRSESRYPAHKLEFLALKCSSTALGSRMEMLTHCDLRDDPSSQKEWDRIRRFTQHHLPDPDNIESVDQGVVRAICERQLIYCANDGMSRDESISLVESLAISGDAVPDSFEREDELGGLPIVPHLSEADLRDKQRADQCIEHVISQIERGETPPPTVRAVLPDLPLLLRELTRLELRNGILYRTRQDEGHTQYQLVLPEELREMVLTSLHDNMGHMGKDRTLDLARARFYWPRMASDIERKVKMCNRCVLRKTLPERAAPLVNILTTRPLELVCMDFLSIEPDRSNTKDILVITDHFTKYAVAIPTSNQKAQTVAKCLWDNFIVHYGIPEKLHSDQGRDFESRLIKQLCEVAGIQKIRTTPYHPRGNPVERFNRTLLGMLGTLENQDKSHWKDFVKPLVHAYNCTRSDVTGFTPYELMFGRQPRLPVDLAFGLPVKEGQQKSHSQYVKHLKSRLEESYKIATRSAAKVAEKNKTRFDKRVTSSALDIGDRVLVRNVRIRGKHKLADKWESTVHLVVKKLETSPSIQ
ncbi:hypothetical protein DPEC_G00167470 [Dallia pectoralis]|uniref:Uncharacterized protein n=2 Tax=Dallia pectoralis TaxID=75939 RepID=A0ACC2GIF6_DALPE|nr:hypothetical protein DPEC_G00167470 [Dallia pectoralis]